MNDPNGMVYYQGEYHLFYQYYPDSTVWGPMHWGHAVSPDMVYWEHLPVALYPDTLGYIFSGSAVVDHENTSGLGKAGEPPLIAIFTHHNDKARRANSKRYQYQSIAYSNDRGRTWTKYRDNPVVPNPGIEDFRDPKVIWYEESGMWVMVLAVYDKVQIYNSPNLINWSFQSEFGIPEDTRLWECPDMFPMKVEETGEEKWVLLVSIQRNAPNGGTATSYFVGDFDGTTFKTDYKKQQWTDYGKDNYAMVTWSNIPQTDGRRLGIGWMSNWQYAQVVPTKTWRSAMTLPRKFTLHKTDSDYKLRSNPVDELSKLEGASVTLDPGTYNGVATLANRLEQNLFKLYLKLKKPNSGQVAVRFSNHQNEYLDVGFNSLRQEYYIDRTHSGITDFSDNFSGIHTGKANYSDEIIEFTIYLDHASVELFADSGRCVMTEIMFPNDSYSTIELVTNESSVELIDGKITELMDIWNN